MFFLKDAQQSSFGLVSPKSICVLRLFVTAHFKAMTIQSPPQVCICSESERGVTGFESQDFTMYHNSTSGIEPNPVHSVSTLEYNKHDKTMCRNYSNILSVVF